MVDLVSNRVFHKEGTTWYDKTKQDRQTFFVRRKNYPFDSLRYPLNVNRSHYECADHPVQGLQDFASRGVSFLYGDNNGDLTTDQKIISFEKGTLGGNIRGLDIIWDSTPYWSVLITQETDDINNIRGNHAGEITFTDAHRVISVPNAPYDNASGGPEIDFYLNGALMASKTLDQSTGTTLENLLNGKVNIGKSLATAGGLTDDRFLDYMILKNGETTANEARWFAQEAEAGFPNLLNRIDRFQIFADAAASSDIKSVNTVSWL